MQNTVLVGKCMEPQMGHGKKVQCCEISQRRQKTFVRSCKVFYSGRCTYFFAVKYVQAFLTYSLNGTSQKAMPTAKP